MCFSTSVSFGVGIVLSVIGVASIKKAQSPSEIGFASIPLIFAVQQITEGFLWLSLSNPTYAALQQVSTFIFLIFAQVIWPILIPFAIFKLEPKAKPKKFLKILVSIGVIVSIYLTYCLMNYAVEANIEAYHIFYKQNYPVLISRYIAFLYIVATILPTFISSIKRMWVLGTFILISYIISIIFYTDYFVSVWCFFASIISIIILVIMNELKNSKK
jgi:hypothetical protein